MKRIAETTFPAKFTVRGTQRYVTVPAGVAERMNLRDGDYLDVTVKWPRMEEFDVDDLPEPAPAEEEKPKRGRRPKNEE